MFLSDKEPVRSHSEKVLRQEEVEPDEAGEEQDDVKEAHKKRRAITELQPAVIDDVSYVVPYNYIDKLSLSVA